MRFREFMRLRDSSQVADIKRLSNVGAVSFGKGPTDKNEERTPHYEIRRSIEMLETNTIVASAIGQLMSFLIPNKRVKVFSKDPKTENFLEQWHEQREGIIQEMKNVVQTNVTCGNGPMEKSYAKTVDGRAVLDNVFSSNDMTRIYVNPDDLNGDEAYLFKLPVGIRQFKYMGEIHSPKFRKITYIKNYIFTRRRIWSIAIPAWKFSIYQSGWSRDNLYGRSQLASAIDVDNIFREILSSWDTIARTRQLDQKIITVADNDSGISINKKQLENLAADLEDADKSYTMFNVPLKMIQQDIRTSQGYDLMEGVFDMVRRMLMMGLLPNHLTPWSDGATTQGAQSAMPAFLGRVKAKQNEFTQFFNKNIIDELRKTYPWIAEDATYVFDEPKVLGDREYIDMVSNLVQERLLTEHQGKLMLIKLGIIDEDIANAQGGESQDTGLEGDSVFGFERAKNKKTFSEAPSAEMSWRTFKKRLRDRDDVETRTWEEIQNTTIGGHDVRLVRSEDLAMLFDGLNLVDTYDLDTVKMGTVRKAYKDYKDQVRKEFNEFEEGDTEEDEMIEVLRDEVKQEIKARLDRILKAFDRRERKTEPNTEGFCEEFVSDKILGDIDDIMKGFTGDINKKIGRTLKDLSVTIKKGTVDDIAADDDTQDLIDAKRRVMARKIKRQVKATRDKMLADMKARISDGLAAGKSKNDLKSEVEKQFNYEDGVGWKFDRIIRTDTRQASGIMRLRKLKKMGFEKFVWITRGDRKVREDHKRRNKKVYSIDDALKGKIIFPGGSLVSGEVNANCRCRMIPFD